MNTLGRYTLIRRLATGGMGEVYLAESEGAANFKKRVAIKRILPHLATSEDFVSKFIDEAHLMVQLHHGNIMPVLELADHDGELYIVMEYLPGRDLKAVIRRLRADGRRMPVDVALWLVGEICAGLDYAHRKLGDDGEPLHVVHRDVSPSNIVLGTGGSVKLVDFGIARARGGMHQSISGTLQGKFVYMSPEQAEGERVDPRSDVFSAGLVLYELLCGVRPFEGESETETLRLVRTAEIVPPSRIRTDLDVTLDPLVTQALERDRAARYPTAAAFRHALTHHLAVSGSTADAGALAAFLRDLFPEGVEPAADADQPMSLDDALNLQLGALTPSIDALGRTRTSSLPGSLVSRGAASAQIPPSVVTSLEERQIIREHPSGRRRFLLLGLLLGVVSAGAAVSWWPRDAFLEPKLIPPVGTYTLTVDDQVHDAAQALRAGGTYSVCVEAGDNGASCHRALRLNAGRNQPVFRLTGARPTTLNPRIEPAHANPVVQVDGRLVSVPYEGPLFRPSAKPYYVCIEAAGFARHCNDVRAEPGMVRPRFSLVAVPPPEPEPDAAVADAQTPESPPPRARRRYVRIESTPVAEVWRGSRRIGVTPLPRVRVESAPATYELRAAGREPRSLTIRPDARGGTMRLTLAPEAPVTPPGFLTVRARPGAATLELDGKPIGVGSVSRLEVSAGRHELIARWRDPAGKPHVAQRAIDIQPGKTAKVTDIDLLGAGP